jgi:nitroimidazol reductase NimA-like FMN-containing flavoprotein (pyridoxamine 5'-phosphate oxidase superfamily)
MTNRFGDDPAATAQALIAANRYLTLGTADASGAPWTSPVWFAATDDLSDVLWVSDPQARHSRNVAARAQVSLVIFDSTAPPGAAQAFYASAVAEQVTGAAVAGAVAAYSRRSVRQGLAAWTEADVTAPARHRLYRATLRECFVLGARDRRVAVAAGDGLVAR